MPPKRDDLLAVRIEPELKRKAQELAEREYLTLSELVRKLLAEYVKKSEEPKQEK